MVHIPLSLSQLKESWEYETAEERKTDAEQWKEKGNIFFKVCKPKNGIYRITGNIRSRIFVEHLIN